jgi:hypothetical protein
VAPTRSLETLFGRIHNVSDPQELVRIAAAHDVDFLPPPRGCAGRERDCQPAASRRSGHDLEEE